MQQGQEGSNGDANANGQQEPHTPTRAPSSPTNNDQDQEEQENWSLLYNENVAILASIPFIQSKRLCIGVSVTIILVLIGLSYLSSFISHFTLGSGNNGKSTLYPTMYSPAGDGDNNGHEPNSLPDRCIPQICRFRERYIQSESEWSNEETKEFIFLASYVSSGNTWIRSLIREGTRVYTGTLNFESDFGRDFEDILVKFAERKTIDDPFEFGSWSPVSVIKTHYPVVSAKEKELLSKMTRAIHIIRSPFDALLAQFAVDHAQQTNNQGQGVGRDSDGILVIPPPSAFHKHWSEWIGNHAPKWVKEMKFWVPAKMYENNRTSIQKTSTGTHYFIIDHQIEVRDQTRTIKVLNMFYEDFMYDFENAMKIMFDFLKESLGDIMPSVRNAIICSMYLETRLDELKQSNARKARLPTRIQTNPFAFYEKEIEVEEAVPGTNTTVTTTKVAMVPSEVTVALCETFADYWFPMKWGVCENGELQNFQPRRTVSKKRMQQSEVAKLNIGKAFRNRNIMKLGFCDN